MAEKAQKTPRKELSSKVTLNKSYPDASIMALVPTLLSVISDIHANDMFLKNMEKGLAMFKQAKKIVKTSLLLHSDY